MQIPFLSPTRVSTRSVELRFDQPHGPGADDKELRDGLSAVTRVGSHLFVASDEGTGLERLTTRDGATFAEHRSFPLAEFLELPGGEEEVDVEGMDYRPPYLWIVGSHALKRKRADPSSDDREREIRRLGKIEDEANRYLLARIPLRHDPETGEYTPCRSCPDPADPERVLHAGRFRGEGRESPLMEALADDRHLGPFLKIPGKDNGFDIEGLALVGERIFLGLRGPVLRGWAVVLEVEPRETDDPTVLKLRKIGPKEQPYRKHFLHLGGLGIRELAVQGTDLLILAGPTMELDGPVVLFRWRRGTEVDEESLVGPDGIERVMEIPYGQGVEAGRDHAEGITPFREPGGAISLLVVYDAPAEARKTGEGGVRADLFPLPE
ncbi:MAG TPA: DUF3616 domain-containing protein [Longimicrobiaceae bacterium]|nr:DUF3616 domain-containing protein [Longimicrobiaceae bacterium]